MNTYQKRIFEWPILLIFLWLEQSLEIAFINRFFAFQLLPIFIIYIAYTRDWPKVALHSAVLAYMGSSHIGYDPTLFVCVSVWTALTIKFFVETFAMEERPAFIWLNIAAHTFSKTLTWILLSSEKHSLSFGHFLADTILGIPLIAVSAWALYPALLKWDDYFEHENRNSNDLNPIYKG